MTQVHWLVEDGPFEEDLEPIITEIERQGHPLKIVKYSPFESGNYGNLYPEDACVVFYGSLNLAHQLQRQTPWIPGPMANFDNYSLMNLYGVFGQHWDLLNYDPKFGPWGYVYNEIYNDMTRNKNSKKSYFIRPNTGNKSFSGQVVYTPSDLLYIDSRCEKHDLVMYHRPLKIGQEYRFIVADNKIVSGSLYKKNNELEPTTSSNIPDKIWKYCQEEILDQMEWDDKPSSFDRMFVMDVAVSFNPSMIEIIELNSVCCSGWYACDPEPIVREMSRIALEEWSMIYGWDKR